MNGIIVGRAVQYFAYDGAPPQAAIVVSVYNSGGVAHPEANLAVFRADGTAGLEHQYNVRCGLRPGPGGAFYLPI